MTDYPLSDAQVSLLEESLERITADGTAVAEEFYHRFFENYPEAKMLFRNTTVVKQARMLMDAMRIAVRSIKEQPRESDYVVSLGMRHEAQYNVRDADYVMFRRTLLQTLADYFDDEWTDEHAEAWTQAMKRISKNMTR